MRAITNRQILAFSMLVFLLTLTGCSSGKPDVKKHAYINARLYFSLSYPEGWITDSSPKRLAGFPDSVLWTLTDENLHNGRLELAVVTITMNLPLNHLDIVKNVMFENHPNFTLHATSMARLPAGPCDVYDGYTPKQSFRIWGIPSDRRFYLLIGASSPERFADNLATFEAIAESFRPLD